MSCEIKYKEEKKDIKGGNKKKLISNLQKRKKKCIDQDIIIDTWSNCNNRELREKLNKIDLSVIDDKQMINLIRTLKQKNHSCWLTRQKIKNYVTQELVFEVFKKLEIYDEYVEGKNYIKIMNNLLSEY